MLENSSNIWKPMNRLRVAIFLLGAVPEPKKKIYTGKRIYKLEL